MENINKHLSENGKAFIEYIFNHFSNNFTKDDLNNIWQKIWKKWIEKYLEETKTYLEKTKKFDFKKFYNKTLPTKRKSHRYIPKMMNLLSYMVHFCEEQIAQEEKNIITADLLQKSEEQKNKEIIKALNSNDRITEDLICNYCNTKNIRTFKYYFAKKYKETEGLNDLNKLITCINSICKDSTNGLEPQDTISINTLGKIEIIKEKDIIAEKYNEFAIQEDEEKKQKIYEPETIGNTIEEILINFFKDHKLDTFGIRKKELEDDTNESLNDLLDK